jgi:predicted aldo/keto reductase-like oxidoreductase
MQYRNFGKLDWKGSALGFGTMRLPQLGKDITSPIDEPEAIKMIRYAIDNGVNYVDTSVTYNMGGSERAVGKALQDGYRQKVKLATKLSWSVLKSSDEFDRYFDEQLERLQTDKIDFYLLHALTALSWKQMKEWKAIQFVEKKIAEGKIDYLGFSFHDTYDVFKEIVDYYDNWTFCQVMYNYTDENNQAGRKGVEYAAAKGMAIVVMEPLRGGLLARIPPLEVAKEWVEAEKERDLVEWALDWVWNQPEISVVLSGMSTMEQVVQNVTYAERSAPNMLKDEDLALFKRVTDAYKSLAPVPCTGCKYCQPCPNGVNIPKVFELYNVKVVNKDYKAKIWYTTEFFPAESRADNCVECEECLEKCPQQINIPEMLKKAHAELTRD